MLANSSHHIGHILESVYRPENVPELIANVDPIILRSWQRCVTHYNLEPSATRGARILTSQELLDHKLSVEKFLYIAKSGLHQLFNQVNSLDYVVLLTDKDGVTVDYIGNDRLDKELREYGLYLGADWNEQRQGTSAVGICTTEMQPVIAHQTDHFDVKNTSLTCSAAPIFDPEGLPLAVLDVSALRSPKNKESQHLLIELVKMHAQNIEIANFLHHFQDNYWILRFGTLPEYVNVNSPYLLAINDQGIICGLDSSARKYFGNTTDWMSNEWNALLGKPISFVFDCDPEELILTSHRNGSVKQLNLKHNEEPVFLTITTPKNSSKSYQISSLETVVKPETSEDTRPSRDRDLTLDDLAGDDPKMGHCIKLAKKLIDKKINFLIQGETGSGKEIFARAMHEQRTGNDRPFIAVNCAAIPESLIESELFGYKPGTFTGARSKGMTGLIEQSSGGTLFLDEIGDMPLHLQTRLLRALSENEILPLGSDKPVPVELNVIAASHKNLEDMISKDQFRQDLFFRIAGVTLAIPPLRERQDIRHIIETSLRIESDNADIQICNETMECLTTYQWPGNVRELRNVLKIALAFCESSEIRYEDIPENLKLGVIQQQRALNNNNNNNLDHLEKIIQSNSKDALLVKALLNNKWNITDTANELNISRATIYRKMKKHNIVPPNQL